MKIRLDKSPTVLYNGYRNKWIPRHLFDTKISERIGVYEQRTARLSGRNHADAHLGPLESPDHPGSARRHKTLQRAQKSIGSISQKVLTANLRSMEASGLLTRTIYPEVPPRVEYTLTETGYSLKPVLDSMVTWGTSYQQNNSAAL